jgi:hypothetical protein
MATPAQIEAAAKLPQRPVDGGWGDHILSLARGDAERERAEREYAARAVRRLCTGQDVAEILDALGLDEAEQTPQTKRCCRCGIVRPLHEFAVYSKGGGRSGRRSYCRGCK